MQTLARWPGLGIHSGTRKRSFELWQCLIAARFWTLISQNALFLFLTKSAEQARVATRPFANFSKEAKAIRHGGHSANPESPSGRALAT